MLSLTWHSVPVSVKLFPHLLKRQINSINQDMKIIYEESSLH